MCVLHVQVEEPRLHAVPTSSLSLYEVRAEEPKSQTTAQSTSSSDWTPSVPATLPTLPLKPATPPSSPQRWLWSSFGGDADRRTAGQ